MRLSRYAVFSWSILAFNLAVIAWGAYVRASGSGAGCGSHWPLCNGEVIPRAEQVKTLVEFSHRASSGVALVLVAAMAIAAFVAFPRGSVVRKAATASAIFMAGEALIGAGLVLLKLVEHDASIQRGVSISLHLVNTFLLLGALVLTAWWASGGERVRLRAQGAAPWLIVAPLVGVLLVGTSGAVAALGDTLFPPRTLAEGLAQDLSGTGHLFVRLRMWHPFLAAGVSVLVLVVAAAMRILRPTRAVRVWPRAANVLVTAQLAAGLLNVYWLAPIPMQLVHLFLADLLWLVLVLLGASALAEGAVRATRPLAGSESPSPT